MTTNDAALVARLHKVGAGQDDGIRELIHAAANAIERLSVAKSLLDEAVTEALKDRDYYERMERAAVQRAEQAEAVIERSLSASGAGQEEREPSPSIGRLLRALGMGYNSERIADPRQLNVRRWEDCSELMSEQRKTVTSKPEASEKGGEG